MTHLMRRQNCLRPVSVYSQPWARAGRSHSRRRRRRANGNRRRLVRYDIKTGQVVEIVEFEPGSCDIHDVTVNKSQLYGVDAGEHPGWSIDVPEYQHPGYPPLNSPSGCYVFRIDLI